MAKSTTAIAKRAPNFDILAPNFSRRPDIKTYRQLNSSRREIRLLRIWQQSSGLYASLEHATLDDKPVYEAVSYCWGPPSTLHPINLDNHVVWISKTLFGFLSALCDHVRELSVWVDQLCINQADSKERSSQVAMMGDIYRSAQGVRAWLGNSDVNIEYTFAYVNAISQGRIKDTSETRQHAMEGFEQICRRPYWRRMWIVQEVGLAKSLTVHCGDHKVDFEDLYLLLSELRPDGDIKIVYEAQQSLRTHATGTQVDSGKSLVEQIIAFQSRICEDKRDRVYALRSLAEDGARIIIDYSKSVYEVLWDVLRHWSDTKSVDWILSFTCTSGTTSGDFEPFPSLMSALGLSIGQAISLASQLVDPMFSVNHYALIEPTRELMVSSSATGFDRLYFIVAELTLEPIVRAKMKRYSVVYSDGSSAFYAILKEYEPDAKMWSMANFASWETPYLIQAYQGRLRIVGFGGRTSHQEGSRALGAHVNGRKTVPLRRRVSLLPFLSGHIQCCPRLSAQPDRRNPVQFGVGYRVVKVHYSLFALMSFLSSDEIGSRPSTFVTIPSGSLCDCNPDTMDEDPTDEGKPFYLVL